MDGTALATTGDATACEYVTPEGTLDVERLTRDITDVTISGNGFSFDASVDECNELFSALAETKLVLKIIPQPTPTPAPGHALTISFQYGSDGGFVRVILKTNEELWLSVYAVEEVYTGRSDVNGDPVYNNKQTETERWIFIIELEDGQRIHDSANSILELAE